MNIKHVTDAAAKRYELFARDYYTHGATAADWNALHNVLDGMKFVLMVAEKDGIDTLKARQEIAELDNAAFNITFNSAVA